MRTNDVVRTAVLKCRFCFPCRLLIAGLALAAFMAFTNSADAQGGFLGPGTVEPSKPNLISTKRSRFEDTQKRLARHEVSFGEAKLALGEIIDRLERELNIPFSLDSEALEQEGVNSESTIEIPKQLLNGIEFLDQVLESTEGDVTFVIKNGEIVITSKSKADAYLVTRFVNVRTLLKQIEWNESGREKLTTQKQLETLKMIIHDTVSPESWQENGGGAGTITEFEGIFKIYQTQALHREIDELLNDLRNASVSNQ